MLYMYMQVKATLNLPNVISSVCRWPIAFLLHVSQQHQNCTAVQAKPSCFELVIASLHLSDL